MALIWFPTVGRRYPDILRLEAGLVQETLSFTVDLNLDSYLLNVQVTLVTG